MAPDMVHIAAASPAEQPITRIPMLVGTLVLPVIIYSPGDLARLNRELETIQTFFTEAKVRSVTVKDVPQATSQLNALISVNNLNLLRVEDRRVLMAFLASLVLEAPVVHMSFATDPKPEFLIRLVAWFRQEAHPHTMLRVGLQPNIAAGCVLRTTNKYFDLSFKQHFSRSKEKLAGALRIPA